MRMRKQPHFGKQVFLTLTFFASPNQNISTEQLISESSVKIKVRSPETFLIILLASAFFSLTTLHGNKIVQYFQNYKCMDRNHFRKRLQSFTKSIKVDFKTTRTIFKDHAILG